MVTYPLLTSVQVWKTLTIGLCRELGEYKRAIENAGFTISPMMLIGRVLEGVELTGKPLRLDLVVVSVGQLGFHSSALYDQIIEVAYRSDLHAVPAETALALPMVCTDPCVDLEMDEHLRIASIPVLDKEGTKSLLCVGRNSTGPSIGSDTCCNKITYRPHDRFVFTNWRC